MDCIETTFKLQAKTMTNRFLWSGICSPNRMYFGCFVRHASKRFQRYFSPSVFEPPKLDSLLNEAEKVVGYPTSLLRCLLSDEISNVLVHSKKLVGSRHPLVKTARRLVYDGQEGFEAVGLIVLLMSRTGEPLMEERAPLGHEPVSGVHRSQRKLAEVAEMINTGYMVHLGVVNKANFHSSDDFKVMNFGNKISILTGDFFLAKASVGLSELENTEVVDIMAGVIGDIVEGEILKDYGKLEDLTWNDWEDIVYKSRGSLIAKSCLAALKLCSLSEMYQDAGFSFGKQVAFLQHLRQDYQAITSNDQPISMTNAALILTESRLKQRLLEDYQNDSVAIGHSTRDLIQNSDTNIKMQDLCNTYGRNALESLGHFPSSEAKTCLENLVKHLMVLKNVSLAKPP